LWTRGDGLPCRVDGFVKISRVPEALVSDTQRGSQIGLEAAAFLDAARNSQRLSARHYRILDVRQLTGAFETCYQRIRQIGHHSTTQLWR